MSRGKELAKNTLILTIGKICTQFVSFLLLPLYTALLTPEEYGVVDLYATYVSLLIPLFNWQFENGLFRFMIDCRGEKDKQAKLFTTVIISNVIQSCLYVCVYLCFQGFLTSEYKIFLLIKVVLGIFLNSLLQFPRGLGNNTTYAVGSFLSATITVAFNVVFIAGFKMGAYGMFIATVIAQLVTILYLAFSQKTWQYFSLKGFNKDTFKLIFKYSIPLVPNQLSWWVVGASDRIIVNHFIGIAANGIYSLANKFSGVYITFFNIFSLSWTESVSLHINDEDRDVFLKKTINTMFSLFSSVCIIIVAAIPLVFPFINSRYYAAYNQIPILMLSVLFQTVVGLYSVIYVAFKKSSEIAKTSIYAAIINIVVDLVLIKFIGLYAASISTLTAYAVMAIYRYFHVKKYIDLPFEPIRVVGITVLSLMVVASYYYNSLYTNILMFIIVVAYAIFANRSIAKMILKAALSKVSTKRGSI